MATHREGLERENLGNPYGVAKYSTFPEVGYKKATTEIFGLITPFDNIEGVSGDTHELHNFSTVETYTMSAPLKAKIWKNKEWFQVPRMAILPYNWEKIEVQPTIGDDIDATEYGTSVKATTWTSFLRILKKNIVAVIDMLQDEQETDKKTPFKEAIKQLLIMEYIYSYGSLLNRLGCKMAALFQNGKNQNFDEVYESIWNIEGFVGFKMTWDDDEEEKVYIVNAGLKKDTTRTSNYEIDLNSALMKMRDNLHFTIEGIYLRDSTQDVYYELGADETEEDFAAYLAEFTTRYEGLQIAGDIIYARPVDIAYLWAYQMVCAEFYTDDQIDYVYNSDIYRQYVLNCISKCLEADDNWTKQTQFFTYNGIDTPIDTLSAYYFNQVINYLDYDELAEAREYTIDYITALFNMKRSLKYKDYFTGGKTRPLAVGDTTVRVNSNLVDIVDISKKSQATKFYLAVKRIGRKIGEYTKGLLGINVAIDYHYPLWLGKTTDTIHNVETENTGEAQIEAANAITSRMKGSGGQYDFVTQLDRYSILIGVTYYDIERYYYRGTNRKFMHVDRFDMFNQFMQYTGDQEVYSEEYETGVGENSSTFAYKPSYEEFKEGINVAEAGFVTALPGWTFLNEANRITLGNLGGINPNVSPDFIRSNPAELDRFYNSLNGKSLSNYFHFIVMYNNGDVAKRPMAYNPEIAL